MLPFLTSFYGNGGRKFPKTAGMAIELGPQAGQLERQYGTSNHAVVIQVHPFCESPNPTQCERAIVVWEAKSVNRGGSTYRAKRSWLGISFQASSVDYVILVPIVVMITVVAVIVSMSLVPVE